MLSLLWMIFWALLVALVVASGISLRARLRREIGAGRPRVDDDALRTIMETGRLVTDEEDPLDLGEIDEAERRFWREDWEEPEEW